MTTLLHGAGDLGALGVPLALLLLLSASTVPALAGLLSARAQGMTSRPAPRYRPLPRPIRAAADSGAVRAVARSGAVLALAAVWVIAAFGTSGMTGNAAPRLALVVLWGGVAAASLLLGPVWRAVSPFRALSRWVNRIADPDGAALRPLPDRLGVWPAALGLGVWAWVAEALPTPRSVALVLLLYTAAQVAGGLWYGQGWFARGEAVEAISGLLGRLAPVGRDDEGRLSVRNPLAGLAGYEPSPGARALIAVLLAWELAHAVRGTEQWPLLLADLGLRRGPLSSTLVLALCVVVCLLAVRGATPRPFLVAAAVPMLAGWTLAHHVGPLLTDWHAALADLSDPLGRGWALYDIVGPPIEPAAPGAVALVQLLLLVGGALVAVGAAHRMAVGRYDLRAARAVQFPLRMFLIAAVLVALALQGAAAE